MKEDLITLINSVMQKLDYSSLISYTGEYSSDRFSAQEKNAALLVDLINKSQDKFIAFTISDWHDMNYPKKFSSLSIITKSNYDRKYGDIVITIQTNFGTYNVVANIDLKLSDNYLGAVNFGSLSQFVKSGYYLCVCKSKSCYKLVSHHDLVYLVNTIPSLLREVSPSKTYTGFPVYWKGKNISSEYYVRGMDIDKYFS